MCLNNIHLLHQLKPAAYSSSFSSSCLNLLFHLGESKMMTLFLAVWMALGSEVCLDGDFRGVDDCVRVSFLLLHFLAEVYLTVNQRQSNIPLTCSKILCFRLYSFNFPISALGVLTPFWLGRRRRTPSSLKVWVDKEAECQSSEHSL